MRLPGLCVTAVFLCVLAGCSSRPAAAAPEEHELGWLPMAIRPAGLPGPAFATVGWREARMAIAEDVPGLPPHAVLDGDGLATSVQGEAWTHWPLQAYQAANPQAERWRLWDVRGLARNATLAPGETTIPLDLDGLPGRESTLTVTVEAWHVASARLDTPLDPQAPLEFTATAANLPMRAQPILDPPAIATGDAAALTGQQTLLGWLQQYHDLLGSVPSEVTPQSLAVQSLGQSWPESPYDHDPMRDGGPSGHFTWRTCGSQDATFLGHAWDGTTVVRDFGKGCP